MRCLHSRSCTEIHLRVLNYSPLEFGVLIHLVEAGPGLRVPQQGLGGHEDQRFPEWQGDLPAENVEVASGGRAVGDDPVDVVELADSKLFAFGWEVVRIVHAHLQKPVEVKANS